MRMLVTFVGLIFVGIAAVMALSMDTGVARLKGLTGDVRMVPKRITKNKSAIMKEF
jgi:hypothetical protein